jgi:hypothetical protein
MALALPGARGLFSAMQDTLGRADHNRVHITRHDVWHAAADIRAIAYSLQSRPTRLQELVPDAPTCVGVSDACQLGMGGVHQKVHNYNLTF